MSSAARSLRIGSVTGVLLVAPGGLHAPVSGRQAAEGVRIDGPPPPTPPAVVSRDGSGNVTVRAVRLTEPLRLDGVLDEAA